MTVTKTYTLSNGVQMPSVGLGTYRVRDQATLDACILEALRSGYRLIDTATVYRNEDMIGNSIKHILENNLVPGLKRQDLFITSKLAPKDQGYDACYQAVQDSLKNLQLDYIDLYLIHWPGTAKLKLPDPQNAINRTESWHALEDLYRAKKLRAIGVSNYTITHLSKMIERPHHSHTPAHAIEIGSLLPTVSHAPSSPSSSSTAASTTTTKLSGPARTMVIPHVHQFEMHPRLFQKDLVEFCQAHRIQVQAYSSLGEGRLIIPKVDVTDPAQTEFKGHLDLMSDLIQKYFSAPRSSSNSTNGAAMEMDMDLDSDSEAQYSKRAAQILLRWGLQHGAVVIPKSTKPGRIRENIDLFAFEIDPSDMSALDAYSIPGERTRYCWDPTGVC